MTYAKNGDLLGLISKLTAKAIDCTQFYAGELIAAVEFLHNQGIIHRDLKPENILLNEKMHLMITDFGSAKLINRRRRRRRTGDNREEPVESDDALEETSDEDGADGAAPPKSKRSSFVGTPEYVSPGTYCATVLKKDNFDVHFAYYCRNIHFQRIVKSFRFVGHWMHNLSNDIGNSAIPSKISHHDSFF